MRFTLTYFKRLMLVGLIASTPIAFGQSEQSEGSASPQADSPVFMTEQELENNLPQDSFAAVEFLIQRMNSAQIADSKVEQSSRPLRFKLTVRPIASGFEPLFLSPEFKPDGSLTIELNLREDVKANPIIALEALTELVSLFKIRGTALTVNGVTTSKYSAPKPIFHPTLGYLTGYHPTATEWVHRVEHFHHQVLHYLGLQVPAGLTVNSPLSWAELYLNANSQSALANREMAEFKGTALRQARQNFTKFKLINRISDPTVIQRHLRQAARVYGIEIPANLSGIDVEAHYFDARQQQAENRLSQLQAVAKQDLRARKRRHNAQEVKDRKLALEELPEKLDHFVRTNNREMVATLLEAYVPFELLEPVEAAFWRQWIHAIRKPNFSNPILLFRGLDPQEPVQRLFNAQGEVTGAGFFAPFLNRNQGNYSRRLRSIETSRLRTGNLSGEYEFQPKGVSPLQIVPKMSTMIYNHSRDPLASLFMSFSSAARVAYSFSHDSVPESGKYAGGFLVIRADRRLVLPNVESTILDEQEFLIPLVVFPDQVVHYEPYSVTKTGGQRDINFPNLADILARASQSYGKDIPVVSNLGGHGVLGEAYKPFRRAEKTIATLVDCKTVLNPNTGSVLP